jgi:hypothetical protein
MCPLGPILKKVLCIIPTSIIFCCPEAKICQNSSSFRDLKGCQQKIINNFCFGSSFSSQESMNPHNGFDML